MATTDAAMDTATAATVDTKEGKGIVGTLDFPVGSIGAANNSGVCEW